MSLNKTHYNRLFHFKSFSLKNQDSAFKINTDGVLLGAWSNVESASMILDIGTGTGVIAHISYQKNIRAKITAIDVDQDSCEEAKFNVFTNNFHDRISVLHTDLSQYSPNYFYDHIISNPPFYYNNTKPKSEKLKIAKHNDSLSIAKFWHSVERLSNNSTKVSVIIPYESLSDYEQESALYGWEMKRLCKVNNSHKEKPIRALIEFRKSECKLIITSLSIYNDDKLQHTDSFKELHNDLYL